MATVNPSKLWNHCKVQILVKNVRLGSRSHLPNLWNKGLSRMDY